MSVLCTKLYFYYFLISFIKVLSKLEKKTDHPALKNILSGLNDQAYYIKQLHETLFDKIKPAADVYLKAKKGKRTHDDGSEDNVADAFVQMKVQFLIYAPFIVHCFNVEKMIELMKIDASVKDEVSTLEDFLGAEMNRTGNVNHPTSFNSLLAFPFQHVIR